MGVGTYLAGVGYGLATWGAAVGTGVVVARRRLPAHSGAPLWLAGALVALLTLIGAHLLPGAVGLLSRRSVVFTALAAATATFFLVPGCERPGRSTSPEPISRADTPSAAMAGLAVALVTVVITAAFLRLATDAPTHVDALSFGLPGVAEWIRTGSLLDAGAFLPLFQVRTYPNTGDVFYLATILPFRNDAFLRFATLPLLGMTGLAVYALAREMRAPRPTAVLLGTCIVAVPSVTQPALDNLKPDVFMYATFAAGLLFLARHARTGLRTDLLLAGAGLGLAFGSRWYGISSAVVVIGLWVAAALLARRPLAAVVRHAAVLSATVLTVGGFWLLRNALLTGNPIYPAKITPFGVPLFDAPPDPITENLGLSIAERLGEPGLFTNTVWPGLSHGLSLPGLVLAVGAAAGFAMAAPGLRRARAGLALRPLALATCALVLAGVYAITPASAQGFPGFPLPGIVGETARWVVPALLAAAGAAAWALARAGRWRVAGEAALLVASVVGVGAAYDDRPADIVVVGALLAALCGVGLLARRSRALTGLGTHKPLILAVTALATVAVVAAGQLDQRRYNEKRFFGVSPVSDWILANAPSGHAVGFAGGWQSGFVPIYPAFGPAYGNSVRYAGPVREGQVREYLTSQDFRGALARDGYDLLVVGRVARPNLKRVEPLRVLDDPVEARWARAAGFTEVTRDGQFVLLRRGSSPGR